MTNLSEQDIRKIVDDQIQKTFSKLISSPNQKDIEYMSTEDAYRKLGYVSPGQLRQAKIGGNLRLGHEVQDRRAKGSLKSRYFFNIPMCIKRLNTPPEQRGA